MKKQEAATALLMVAIICVFPFVPSLLVGAVGLLLNAEGVQRASRELFPFDFWWLLPLGIVLLLLLIATRLLPASKPVAHTPRAIDVELPRSRPNTEDEPFIDPLGRLSPQLHDLARSQRFKVGTLTIVIATDQWSSRNVMLARARELQKELQAGLAIANWPPNVTPSVFLSSVRRGSVIIDYAILLAVVGATTSVLKDYEGMRDSLAAFLADVRSMHSRYARAVERLFYSTVADANLRLMTDEEVQASIGLSAAELRNACQPSTKDGRR